MKWHRTAINGLVGGLVVNVLDIHNAVGQIVVLVLLCTLLAILGIRDDENN